MPFFQQIDIQDAHIYIWKLTETVAQLKVGLTLSQGEEEREKTTRVLSHSSPIARSTIDYYSSLLYL